MICKAFLDENNQRTYLGKQFKTPEGFLQTIKSIVGTETRLTAYFDDCGSFTVVIYR